MSRVVYTSEVAHKDVDLSWMVGCLIADVTFHEPNRWKFALGNGRSIGVECLWRVVTAKGTAVTSEDHHQRFGLPTPVDAAAECLTLLAPSPVSSVALDELTADLSLVFGGDLRLDIVSTSRGYENWQVHDPNGTNYVASGTAKIFTWNS